MNIDALLQPLGWREFERSYFRQRPLLLTGPANRFASLVTPDKLETALSTHRFTPRRLSFIKAGSSAHRDRYLWKFKEEAALVRADGVKQLIEAGYHLNLNGVDELWPDVRAIAEAWEAVVGSYVAVNLYAVWTGQHGFRIHTDSHDTLLLQVDGAKHWSVYAPDAAIDTTLAEQTATPAVKCLLRPGDLLYMPKGWWHVGRAEGGRSIHLTVGVDGDPASLFLQWCVREWKSRDWASRPMPWPDSSSDTGAFLAELADTLRRELTSECYARFRAWKAASTAVRPRLDFEQPHVEASLSPDSLIRWRSQVHITGSVNADGLAETGDVNAAAGQTSLSIDGWTLSIPPSLVPAVRRIQMWPAVTWHELSSAISSADAVPLLENWVSAMVLGGHLVVDSSSASRRCTATVALPA